jgi:hypothetical protein
MVENAAHGAKLDPEHVQRVEVCGSSNQAIVARAVELVQERGVRTYTCQPPMVGAAHTQQLANLLSSTGIACMSASPAAAAAATHNM